MVAPGKSRSGFVELAPTCVATAGQLYEWLEDCHGLVERVEWQSSKASQGNAGDHASQRNIKVFPRRHRAGSATHQLRAYVQICR